MQGTSVAARAGLGANGEGVADVEKTKDNQRSDKMSREQRSEGRPKQVIVAADEDRRERCTGGMNVERDSVPLSKEHVQLSADQLPAENAPPPVDQTPPPTNCAPPPVADSPSPTEIVPPPTPSPMDMLAEEDEEEVDKQEDGACWDTKQSHTIPKDVQLFGEIVVRRLSSLLECRAADNKNELDDEEHSVDTHVTSASRLHVSEQFHHQESNRREQLEFVNSRGERCADDTDHSRSIESGIASTEDQSLDQHDTNLPEMLSDFRDNSQLPLSHIESSSSRPLSLDTLDTLSTDQDTSSSSKRTSTASTATDETLTSFKTRSTTDSAEFEESSFILLESLVFVRSVDEDEGVRPTAQEDLDNSESAWESQGEKPRQKRRRQVGNSLEVPSVRVDAVEPEPKRGSQRIRDVIDAYHEENSDDSYISSCSECASHRDVSQEVDLVSQGDEPLRSSPKEYVQRTTHTHRTTKHFQGDRRSASSDSENGEEASGGQRGSSNVDSSLRIPEIEDTFGELMSVKTFLEDLQDRTPTAESQPVFLNPADVRTKDFWSARRRSKTSPARTDRTESDLDTSEQRDDASTDSMYADDEDDGAEVVFQRSYSEEHGGEVLLSCTIYNSSHDNDADSDDFWAESSAAEESYKQLETSADAAGSAFQNARLQMHDIHQHLQDLRRQMELLQEDITSTSLTLTPEYSFESCEQRPVTE
ncbi:uncharacterized protein LOC112556618 [Pomacea canaliculata]|nr:uncharacterized protein LOC112556618 [Pomacea canaliculata]